MDSRWNRSPVFDKLGCLLVVSCKRYMFEMFGELLHVTRYSNFYIVFVLSAHASSSKFMGLKTFTQSDFLISANIIWF